MYVNTYQRLAGHNSIYTGTAAGTPPSLGAITDEYLVNPGASTNLSSTVGAYISSSLELTATLSAGLNQGNLAYGIRGLVVATRNLGAPHSHIVTRFQSTISPAIMKDNTKVLQFGVKFGWARK